VGHACVVFGWEGESRSLEQVGAWEFSEHLVKRPLRVSVKMTGQRIKKSTRKVKAL